MRASFHRCWQSSLIESIEKENREDTGISDIKFSPLSKGYSSLTHFTPKEIQHALFSRGPLRSTAEVLSLEGEVYE